MKNLKLFGALFLTTALFANTSVIAQEWPTKPVKVIVPFDAGSTPDFAARLLGERLATQLKQPFVVENRSGAAGNIGTNVVAKAKADGYTLGVSIAGPLGVNALLMQELPYDPKTDLQLVTVAVSQPSVLVVGPKLTAQTAQELIDSLEENTTLSYASIGAGSISHLAMAALMAQTEGDAVHVPYRGSGAAVTAVLSGDVEMALLPAATVMPHVQAGKLRALAVASPERSASLPDIPTLAESGLPDIKGDAWIGVIAPADIPPAILKTLHETLVNTLNEAEVQEQLRARYMDPVGNTSEAFHEQLQADLTRWQPIIEKNQIQQ